MISFLCDVLLGLTQEIYTYSSVATAEIDFKNMYMASLYFFFLKKNNTKTSESIQKRAVRIIQELKKMPYQDT